MIARLKSEIQELKNQLTLATGEQSAEELTEEDIERYKTNVGAPAAPFKRSTVSCCGF